MKLRYENEEKQLQFDHFSNEDALELGLMLVNYAKVKKYVIAIDITVNGYQIFRYGFSGTNIHNDMWLRRKIKTVNTVHKSTLHVGELLKLSGEEIGIDWHLDPENYAFHGGGFPINVIGTGVVGSICVSGRPHEEDHQIIIDVLHKYLKKEVS